MFSTSTILKKFIGSMVLAAMVLGFAPAPNAVAEGEFGTILAKSNNAQASYQIRSANSSDTTVYGTGGGLGPNSHPSIPASDGPGTGYQVIFADNVPNFYISRVLVTYRSDASRTDSFAGTTGYLNLKTNDQVTVMGEYAPTETTQDQGTIRVTTNNTAATYQILNDDGLIIRTGSGLGPTDFRVDSGASYEVRFDDVTAVGCVFHANPVSVNNLVKDEIRPAVGTYQETCSTDTGTVTVKQSGAPSLGTVKLKKPDNSEVDVTLANQSFTATPVGPYSLSTLTAPANYRVKEVKNKDGVVLTAAPYTQSLAKDQEIIFDIVYELIPVTNDTAMVRVTTNVTAPVSVDGSLIGNAGPSAPVSTTVRINQAHTISFGAVAGYTKPADVTIAANTLVKDEIRDYTGTYILVQAVSITKAPPTEVATAYNNKLFHYTITVTRNTDENRLLNNKVTLRDTITGVGKIVANGGELNVVPGTCKIDGTVSSACVDVQPIELLLDHSGSAHTITYDMRSNNSAQTLVASFSNVATATFTDPDSSEAKTVTAGTSVLVGPVPQQSGGTGSSTSYTGGSGYGGGGYTFMKGDLKLKIEKMVSFDGSNFRAASGEKLAVAVPENKSTRLYYKVLITNISDVSAKDLRFEYAFDSGKSDMVAGAMENLKGASLDKQGKILIEKVKVGEAIRFEYSVLVHENGSNVNPAIDSLQVIDVDSFLPTQQDGLTYVNLGEKADTYLYAGLVPFDQEPVEKKIVSTVAPRNSFSALTDDLRISVTSDSSIVPVGDTANFTLILENVGEADLTNLIVTHRLPSEMSFVKAAGKIDGHEVTFKLAILRPGEKIARRISAKVLAGAPGDRLESLTQVLVSEIENVTPVESYIVVGSGAPTAARSYHLVQTGPAGLAMLLLFSILMALGFKALERRRAIEKN